MRDRPRTCRFCSQAIYSDLRRGWVSEHHRQRTPYGTLVTEHWVMWTRCHAEGRTFVTRHQPIPVEPAALMDYLDA